MPAKIREIEESIDGAQQVIRWNVIFQVEGIEQSVLVAAVSSHHAVVFLCGPTLRPRKHTRVHEFFNRIGRN